MFTRKYFQNLSRTEREVIIKLMEEKASRLRDEAISLQQDAQNIDTVVEKYEKWNKEVNNNEEDNNPHRWIM